MAELLTTVASTNACLGTDNLTRVNTHEEEKSDPLPGESHWSIGNVSRPTGGILI